MSVVLYRFAVNFLKNIFTYLTNTVKYMMSYMEHSFNAGYFVAKISCIVNCYSTVDMRESACHLTST